MGRACEICRGLAGLKKQGNKDSFENWALPGNFLMPDGFLRA